MMDVPNLRPTDQKKINRQLWNEIEKLKKSSGNTYDDTDIKNRIKAVEDEIGADNKANTIKGRIKTLENG